LFYTINIHFVILSADTGHKPPVIFPSSTAAAYRTDPEWKSRRSFRVCTGGACPKGRGKCKSF
jgi:hypothetical protein